MAKVIDGAMKGARAWATIDLAALRHNLRCIRQLAPAAKLLAVIKADAYGHGLATLTPAIAAHVDGFAVATVEEGLQCRRLQADKPIVVLSAFWTADQLPQLAEAHLQAVIHTESQAEWLCNYYRHGQPLAVWLKFDSGMHRLGLTAEQIRAIHPRLSAYSAGTDIGLMSHIANADLATDTYTAVQQARFAELAATWPGARSMANSAALCRYPTTHYDWVRPGIMLYGASPFAYRSQRPPTLRPVMHLQARVLAIKAVAADQPIGYHGGFRTARPMRLAVVGIGYGDGYPRGITHGAVLIGRRRAPLIGAVSMDMLTIDATEFPALAIGDAVTLWGPGLAVEEVASWAKTIPNELLCRVTARVARVVEAET